jgi:8-oxo-dGTP pyrophosphatase MutT (NUDIX family)
MWECVGGSVTAGEDSITGALREVFEEVGIKLDPDCGRVVFSRVRDCVDGKRFGDIMDVWLFRYDGDVSLAKATTDEVAEVHWMTREQIEEIYAAGLLVPTLEYFFTEVDKL